MGNEWALTGFTAFVCLAAGISVAVAAGELLDFPVAPLVRAARASIGFMLLGALAAAFSLGRPEMIFGVLGHPGSQTFWEVILLAASLTSLACFVAAHRRSSEAAVTRGFALAAGLSAVLLADAVGSGLLMPWRAAWNTHAIPLAFLGWTLVIETFAFKAIASAAGRPQGSALRAPAVVAIAAALVLAYIAFIALNPDLRADGTALRPLTGDLSAVFWIGVVAVGAVAPLALALRSPVLSVKACVLAIACAVIGTAAFQELVYQLGMPTWHFFGS